MSPADRPPEDHPALERLIGSVCRIQPPRAAPASLHARIMSEVERRAAQPTWRRPFRHWPLALRLSFAAAVAAAVAVAAALPVEPWSVPLDWLRSLVAGATFAGALGHLVVVSALQAIPAPCLYALALGAAAMYAVLAGLAFLTHRTLEYPS